MQHLLFQNFSNLAYNIAQILTEYFPNLSSSYKAREKWENVEYFCWNTLRERDPWET